MKKLYFIFFALFIICQPLFSVGTGGYREWQDDLNHYQFQDSHYYDAVSIIPLEDSNPTYYDFPYLDPHYEESN